MPEDIFCRAGEARARKRTPTKKRRDKVLTKRRYTRNKPVVVVFLESSVDSWAKSKILMLNFHVITLNNIKLNLN